MEGIGRRIFDRRKELDMTQEQLAKKLGYKSKSSIARIESGEREFSQKKLVPFARALDVSPAWLLGLIDYETEKKNREAAENAQILRMEARKKKVEKTANDPEIKAFAEDIAKLTDAERSALRQVIDVFLQKK